MKIETPYRANFRVCLKDPDFNAGDDEEVLDAYGVRDKFHNKTAHQQEMWADAVAACMAAMPNKCAHCGTVSCTLKKDGYSRILKKPMSKRQRSQSNAKSPQSGGKTKKTPTSSKKKPLAKGNKGGGQSDDDDSAAATQARAAVASSSDSSEDEDSGEDPDEDADVMDSDVKERYSLYLLY